MDFGKQPLFAMISQRIGWLTDRQRLLDELCECAATHKVAIHAYVLMDNHLHLLATPETAEGLSRMMQALGRRYVAAFNKRHSRSGTLWDGRFRAAPIEAGAYQIGRAHV